MIRLVRTIPLVLIALLIVSVVVLAATGGISITIGGDSEDAASSDLAPPIRGDVGGVGASTNSPGGVSNFAEGDFATVGGGRTNVAGGGFATISGGGDNIATHYASVVGGGIQNQTRGNYSVVNGGSLNRISSDHSVIGGGENNIVSAQHSSISGGEGNKIEGALSVIAGGADNAANGAWSAVGGGLLNLAIGDNSVIAGGEGNVADGSDSNIAGGHHNVTTMHGAAVGGGSRNESHGVDGTVGGGLRNRVTSGFATIGGGRSNRAESLVSTIAGGGGLNFDFGDGSINFEGNRAYGIGGAIGGGSGNVVGEADNDTLNVRHATVSGGHDNIASGLMSTVGGGHANVASGKATTVGGGSNNLASGNRATVPGGQWNEAHGGFSFAAGLGAKIDRTHHGAFLFADTAGGRLGPTIDFRSEGPNEFAVRATGGTRFVSAVDEDGAPASGVELAPGGGSWSSLSDLNAKTNFALVSGLDVLERLSEIPIETWSYRTQDPSVRHIGPTAQDFYRAFALGESDTRIATIDADGVALAAIQGLHELIEQKDARIAALESRLSALEDSVDSRKTLMGSLSLVLMAMAGLAVGALALVWRRGPR